MAQQSHFANVAQDDVFATPTLFESGLSLRCMRPFMAIAAQSLWDVSAAGES